MEMNHPEAVFPLFFGCFGLTIGLAVLILSIVIWCRIFAKAGYHWALGLIMLIPVGNLVMMLILAFSEWPIERELRYRQGGAMPAGRA